MKATKDICINSYLATKFLTACRKSWYPVVLEFVQEKT